MLNRSSSLVHCQNLPLVISFFSIQIRLRIEIDGFYKKQKLFKHGCPNCKAQQLKTIKGKFDV